MCDGHVSNRFLINNEWPNPKWPPNTVVWRNATNECVAKEEEEAEVRDNISN